MMGHRGKKGDGKESAAAQVPGAEDANRGMQKGYVFVAIVYLLGLCMGALDMGIVNPARTVIQNTLGVDDALGVWVITIYSLAYAVSIPIMGKLADRHGRKNIYLVCIALFGIGSALCGLAQAVGSFEMLIGARVIQAFGGGGIMPVATAEFGTAFPEEKRGMALGITGMVYGLASILGPTIGSALLDVFGFDQWQYIFYVNIPVCVFVLVFGVVKLPKIEREQTKPIDGLGILILTLMTLSLMYGLKNIDFFDFAASFTSLDVWPYIVGFFVLLPLFIVRERKTADPILDLSYFKNLNIVIAMVCAVIAGISMMGTIFFPQFCENAMTMRSGSGGYFIALLGVGSGVGAMMSGKLIDKHGVRPVLGAGFLGVAVGSLFMAFVACKYPNLLTVCATMIITGLGLGFTMGTPLNYMMLENTDESESNSALAALSLVRSIGTAVAPAIMVAFVAHAGTLMQDNIMDTLPKQVSVSALPYAQEIDDELDELRSTKEGKKMLKGVDIPKLMDYQTIDINMDADDSEYDFEITDEDLDKVQNSDVTTIVDACKDMSVSRFGPIRPQLQTDIQDGMDKGIKKMEKGAKKMDKGVKKLGSAIDDMSDGVSGIEKGIAGLEKAVAGQDQGIAQMEKALAGMEAAKKKQDAAMAGSAGSKPGSASGTPSGMPAGAGSASSGHPSSMPSGMGSSSGKSLDEQIKDMRSQISTLKAKRAQTQAKLDNMKSQREEMLSGRTEMRDSLKDLKGQRADLNKTVMMLTAARDGVPALLDEAQNNYLVAIDENSSKIQDVYRNTLNGGFKGMAIFVTVCALIGALALIPYREKILKKKAAKKAE